MNVTSFNTIDYENISNWTLGENKPNSNLVLSAVEWANVEKARSGRAQAGQICQNGTKSCQSRSYYGAERKNKKALEKT